MVVLVVMIVIIFLLQSSVSLFLTLVSFSPLFSCLLRSRPKHTTAPFPTTLQPLYYPDPDPTTPQDLPDVEGDRKYKISTFASKRGVKFTARAACAVLGLNYVSAIAEGILSPGEP